MRIALFVFAMIVLMLWPILVFGDSIDEQFGGEEGLQTEGAVAKYMATESGNKAAEDAIQALGGYGYTKEYMVEKIKRDVRITCIYEGTSEIMEWTIARDRWQQHLKTQGAYYNDWAARLDTLHAAEPQNGANFAALAMRALAVILERARVDRLTRNQHVLFRLGELVAWAETAAVFAERVTALLEARLRERDNIQNERSRRFAPLVRTWAEGEDEMSLLTMLIDEYYQQMLHKPVAPPETGGATPTPASNGSQPQPERRRRPRRRSSGG